MNKVQEILNHEIEERSRKKSGIAEEWGIARETLNRMIDGEELEAFKVTRRIAEKSGIDPRVLLGMPDIAICLLCRGKMHVNRLGFESEGNRDSADIEDCNQA